MNDFRSPKIILEEINDIRDVIQTGEKILLEFHGDSNIKFMLDQDKEREKRLVDEYKQTLLNNRVHVLDFVFETNSDKLPLTILNFALQEFNQLLNKIREKLVDKKSENIELYLDSIFSGSYGILLSTPWDNKLINSEYEDSFKIFINTINKILKENDAISIHDILQTELKGNKETIRKYKKFFEAVKKAKTPIKIKWGNPIDKKEYTVQMNYNNIENLYNFLSTERPIEKIIEITGKIKAIDLLQHTIKLQTEDIGKAKHKKIIQSKFSKDLEYEIKNIIDKTIKIKFKLITEYNETTEEEIERWELIEIAN